MNNKKLIFGSMIIFSLVLVLCLAMKSNLTYATEDVVKTYYLDDLKVGDFIEPGANMVVNYDYHSHYSDPGYVASGVTFRYYVENTYSNDYCNINTTTSVESLSESLLNDGYIGWEVVKIYANDDSGFFIALTPVKEESSFTERVKL